MRLERLERKGTFDALFHLLGSAVAILDTGAVRCEAGQQPGGFRDDMALAAFDLLARIKTMNTAAFGRCYALALDCIGRW